MPNCEANVVARTSTAPIIGFKSDEVHQRCHLSGLFLIAISNVFFKTISLIYLHIGASMFEHFASIF